MTPKRKLLLRFVLDQDRARPIGCTARISSPRIRFGPLGVRNKKKPATRAGALRSRNTRYQAGAAPYLGRSSTGWIAPACLAHSFDHPGSQGRDHEYSNRTASLRIRPHWDCCRAFRARPAIPAAGPSQTSRNRQPDPGRRDRGPRRKIGSGSPQRPHRDRGRNPRPQSCRPGRGPIGPVGHRTQCPARTDRPRPPRLARHPGAAHAHDLLRQGATGRGL
jgi:hypothetical protein